MRCWRCFVILSVALVFVAKVAQSAGKPEGVYCIGDRKFEAPAEKKGFQFRSPQFTLANSYWLAILSFNMYNDAAVVLPEMRRWGFKESADAKSEKSEDHLEFLSESREAKQTVLGLEITVPYADSQALWAESKDGVLLAFRGTSLEVKADMITDLRVKYHPTREMGHVHLGFWGGLQIIWDDLYRHAIRLRRRDFEVRRAVLDSLSALPEGEADADLETITDWKIPLEGKRNFLRVWRELRNAKAASDSEARLDELFRLLNTRWRTGQRPIWITGHSLGGGLAQIAAARLLAKDFNVAGLYTFGSPRAGDGEFRHFVEVKAHDSGIRENVVRFRNFMDAVPCVPPVTGLIDPILNPDGWADVGRLKYFPERRGDKVEMLTNALELTDLPKYVRDLPLERVKDWVDQHQPSEYVKNIESLVFGETARCP